MSRTDVRNALILSLLGALVRFPTLGDQSFDRDEAFTVGGVLRPNLFDTLAIVPDETSPPVFYVLAWICSKLFGTGEFGMRSVSALAGVATVPVAYELGRTLVSRRVAVVIGALVAVNPLLFWYSQEARPYSLFVLLSALSLLFLAKALEDPTRLRLTGWAAASVLAFATHWFAGFLIAAEAVWLLARSRDRRGAVLAVLGAGVAMAPLLPLLIHQAKYGGGGWIATIDLGVRLRKTGELFVTGVNGYRLQPAPLIAAALAGVGLALLAFRADAHERRGALLALGFGAAAVLIPLASSLVGPDFLTEKNLLSALVPLFLGVAAGFGARRAGKLGLAAAAGLCALSLWMVAAVSFDRSFQRWDWRGAVQAMGAPEVQRAIVLPFNGDASLEIYLDRWQRLEEGGARVSEVVVFGWVDPRSVRLPPGFRRVERRQLTNFPMLRFRAARPRTVSRRALVMLDVGEACNPGRASGGCEKGTVLLQRPTG